MDDTLYREMEFVESGFGVVAEYLYKQFKWPIQRTKIRLLESLKNYGRGFVFDSLLKEEGVYTKCLVKSCVSVYRGHTPDIKLFPEADRVLKKLRRKPYLVTDGHKNVQNNKVTALGLKSRFEKIYITRRYGLVYEKPHLHCFEMIKRRENCEWSDMCYVGDNPLKDFVNLNQVGVHTIRVLTGGFSTLKVGPDLDANKKIATLDELESVINKLL